jgi:multidrug resistance efflux pump
MMRRLPARHAKSARSPMPKSRRPQTAVEVLERRLEKTTLRAPADGTVSVIVAEVGENVKAGQPVLAIAATDKQWLSFNALGTAYALEKRSNS